MSGSVAPSQQDGGASAYQSSAGGTEYRDVATTGGGDGSNFAHLLSQVTSPMGEVTKFERGANGRISKVTYPDGGIRQLTYDSKNRPGLIELPQGQVVSLEYDTVGREISRTVYNRDGQALTPTGEFRMLSYGVGDRIEEMEDPTGVTTYSYDAAGRFTGITYPSGASVKYTRDKLDRTTDVRVKPKAAAAEIVTHYVYDPNGNLAEITDSNGGVTGFAYDDADRLTSRVLPNGVVTSYGYDSRDRVLSVVHRGVGLGGLRAVRLRRAHQDHSRGRDVHEGRVRLGAAGQQGVELRRERRAGGRDPIRLRPRREPGEQDHANRERELQLRGWVQAHGDQRHWRQ
jgi:YD repeat-containing protein